MTHLATWRRTVLDHRENSGRAAVLRRKGIKRLQEMNLLRANVCDHLKREVEILLA